MASKKKKSSAKKLWITIGVVLIILTAFAVLGRATGWIGGEAAGTQVETSTVDLRTITQLVTASGRIQPEIEVKLAPDVSGEIIELSVKEGDSVEEGDLLLRIRPDMIEARIDELNANLMNQKARQEQSRASMLQSEITYDKQKRLYERELISELDYMNALRSFQAEQANYNASRYMVQNAQAQMRRAEEELRQTVIRAPMTGTISKLNVERGERVVGSIQMTGTELLRIARMEQMEVTINVNENDIVNVSRDNIARIQVDAYPGEIYEGTVTEIANSPDIRGEGTTEQITEYPVKIRIHSLHNQNITTDSVQQGEVQLDIPVPHFKPGMTATVDIETQTVHNVVAIPIQAVTVRDFNTVTFRNSEAEADNVEAEDSEIEEEKESGSATAKREDLRRVVFLVKDGEALMTEVQTGISDDSYIHIKTGLNSGDEVVTGNYRTLTRVLNDGDKIEVSNRDTRALISQ